MGDDIEGKNGTVNRHQRQPQPYKKLIVAGQQPDQHKVGGGQYQQHIGHDAQQPLLEVGVATVVKGLGYWPCRQNQNDIEQSHQGVSKQL